jgi:tetratricopeptide (TPR) repeat protein
MLHPDDFMLNFDYALALTKKSRWTEAVGYFRTGLAIRPLTSGMWRQLGIAYRERADSQQAIEAFNRSIELLEDHAPTWVDLGRARYAAGDVDGALDAYRQALDLVEDLPEAHCFFGLALMEQGRLTDAWVQLRIGHQKGSADPTWEHPSAGWIADCERRIASGIRQSEAGRAPAAGES